MPQNGQLTIFGNLSLVKILEYIYNKALKGNSSSETFHEFVKLSNDAIAAHTIFTVTITVLSGCQQKVTTCRTAVCLESSCFSRFKCQQTETHKNRMKYNKLNKRLMQMANEFLAKYNLHMRKRSRRKLNYIKSPCSERQALLALLPSGLP